MRLVALNEAAAGAVRPALWALWAAVGCVLLIVCANVASLGLALGAQRRNVVWLVLSEVCALTAAGALFGVLAAWGATRYVASLLFDVTPHDPLTLALATLLLLSVATLAGYLPARRAAQVDPLRDYPRT